MARPGRRRWPRAALALATALALSAGVAGAQTVERVTRDQVIEKLAPVPLQTAPGAPLRLDTGGTVPGIAPPRRLVGAPPRFGVPVGGRADKRAEPGFPGYSRVTVRRANGHVYASAMLAPSGDYEEVEYFDRGGEPTYLTVSLLRAEDVARPAPRPSHAVGPSKLPTLGDDGGAPPAYEPTAFCGRNFHAGEPHRLRGAFYGFRINAGSFPAVPLVHNAIVFGADNWNSHHDWCGIPEASTVQLTYEGLTPTGAGSLDGVNTIIFDDPAGRCGSTAVLACAIIWKTNGVLLEADLLFNVHQNWMTYAFYDPVRYDLEGVATHEFGHIVGLAHVNSPGEVMYPAQGAGDITDRRLGRGDAEFLNRKY